MKLSTIIVPVLGIAAAAGAVAWHYMTLRPPTQAAVFNDPSLSNKANCGGLTESLSTAIMKLGGIREGSTFSMLTMGKDPRNAEPDLDFVMPIPLPPDQVYNRTKQQHVYEEELAALTGRVQSSCEEAVAGTHSPIYALVKRGIAHLRSPEIGCGPEGLCYALIKTDLQDDADPRLNAVLDKAARNPGEPVPAELAASLDNAGISLDFCGTSEVRTRPATGTPVPSPDESVRIWRSLFTHPELVSFRPYCASPGA